MPSLTDHLPRPARDQFSLVSRGRVAVWAWEPGRASVVETVGAELLVVWWLVILCRGDVRGRLGCRPSRWTQRGSVVVGVVVQSGSVASRPVSLAVVSLAVCDECRCRAVGVVGLAAVVGGGAEAAGIVCLVLVLVVIVMGPAGGDGSSAMVVLVGVGL